ncbi:MAG: glycosyltransferase family 2 protein [Chitinophagales bacterium]
MPDKKMSILVSTINDRIYGAEHILLQLFDDTEFIVIHQLTDVTRASTYQEYYNKFIGKDIHFIQQFETGTGKSRNTAMQHATGELFYLCDDDLILKPDFYRIIMQASDQYPDADIFTFKIETTEGDPFKNYKAHAFKHNLRSSATVSIVEMVIRKTAYKKGIILFDERFGLSTIYNTGEEFVMLAEALKKGAKIQYVPEFIVQHPKVSSGKIWNAPTAVAKGAMIAKVYGWKFIFINGAFALRKFSEYRSSLGFFNFIFNIYKGSIKFLKNE